VLESEIVGFQDYQYKRNHQGNYHRVLDRPTHEKLLEFYGTHLYLCSEFVDATILERSHIEMESLAQCAFQKERGRLDRLTSFGISPDRTSRLLELGCGCGAFLSLWEHQGFGTPEGIDISTLAIPVSARLWRKSLNISVGEISETLSGRPSQKSGSYDIVAAFDIIEHIWKPEPVIQQIHSLLKPHGLCVIEVPIVSPLWSWKQVTNFELFYPQHHLHLFTRQGIEAIFAEAGFTTQYKTPSRNGANYFMVFER
jgi:2-polyprenyl-3-methyl-5-hydroxy-6-metoxy-1,4-benzoquinol methylase